MSLARRIIPVIDPARCTGCGRCVSACPPRLFSLEPEGWHKISVLRDDEDCTGCAKCAVECPVRAITMHKRKTPADMPLAAEAATAGRGPIRHGYNSINTTIEATHAKRPGHPD